MNAPAATAHESESLSIELPSAELRYVIGRRALEAIRRALPDTSAGDYRMTGVAIGRLALGTDSRTVVEILGVETFRCRSGSGRSIAIHVAGICERARYSGALPLAWVRSAGPDTSELNERDLAVADRYFLEDYHTVLLVRRETADRLAGMIFVRSRDGTLAADSPAERFDFEGRQAASVITEPARVGALPTRRFIGALSAAGLLLFGAALVYRPHRAADRPAIAPPTVTRAAMAPAPLPPPAAVPAAPRTPRSGQALTVQIDGADVLATWNRSAPLFDGATAAVLLVRDGTVEKQIALNLDVPGGMMLFTPKTDDVEVQVRTSGMQERSEIVHVVAAVQPEPAPPVRRAAAPERRKQRAPVRRPRRFVPPAGKRSGPAVHDDVLPNPR